MLKARIDIMDALRRAGLTYRSARTTKVISQSTLNLLSREELNGLTLDSLNTICSLLDMQPKDLLEYVETPEDEMKRLLLNKLRKKA